MKTFICLCLSWGLCFTLAGQTISRSVIGTAGSSNPQLSYTIGETIINTSSNANIILTQGFQQADEISGTYIDPHFGTVNYLLYPNPTQATLVLELETSKAQLLRVSFCDAKGKIVMGAPDLAAAQHTTATYDVGSLAAGTYVLVLQNQAGQLVQSMRFVKTD